MFMYETSSALPAAVASLRQYLPLGSRGGGLELRYVKIIWESSFSGGAPAAGSENGDSFLSEAT